MNQSPNFAARVGQSIEASISAKQALLRDQQSLSTLARICEALVTSLKAGHKVLLFGNGGSAADAQHIAAEWVWTR